MYINLPGDNTKVFGIDVEVGRTGKVSYSDVDKRQILKVSSC